jgi:hypothetical protein
VFQGHDLGTVHIHIPEEGYSYPGAPERLSSAAWIAKVKAATDETATPQSWRWIGPGNDSAPDSCLVLKCEGDLQYSHVVINIQSKQRSSTEPVNPSKIQQEANKVPYIQDERIAQVLLYVTDEKESTRSEANWPVYDGQVIICPIFWYQQEAVWGGAVEIKEALWGPKRQRIV